MGRHWFIEFIGPVSKISCEQFLAVNAGKMPQSTASRRSILGGAYAVTPSSTGSKDFPDVKKVIGVMSC